MNALCELVIRIDPENRRIRLENEENGIISYKEISPEGLIASFQKSIRTDSVKSGFLPPNCFHVEVHADKSKTYCLWHPELYADISYYGTEYEHFPLPRLVFGFQVSEQGMYPAVSWALLTMNGLRQTQKCITIRFPMWAVSICASEATPCRSTRSLTPWRTYPVFCCGCPTTMTATGRDTIGCRSLIGSC